jgi:hypothetical protein
VATRAPSGDMIEGSVTSTLREDPAMKTIALAAPVIAALAGGLIALAPVAAAEPAPSGDTPISAKSGAPVGDQVAGTDPLLPLGTDPQSPVRLGYVDRNHDEGTTNDGTVDAPF